MFGIVLAVVCIIFALLFVIFAFIFLVSVPNRLEEISFYMRKMVEFMEGNKLDDDPSDDD